MSFKNSKFLDLKEIFINMAKNPLSENAADASKYLKIMEMICRPLGVTLEEAMNATQWTREATCQALELILNSSENGCLGFLVDENGNNMHRYIIMNTSA